jgi:hypothetical protein
MIDMCPICGTPLVNGKDSKQMIKYPPEKLQEFAAGLLSIEQLNDFAIIYYHRERLCPNSGNNDFTVSARYKGIEQDEAIKQAILKGDTVPISPPCPNYHGGDLSNPAVVVETIEIIDN